MRSRRLQDAGGTIVNSKSNLFQLEKGVFVQATYRIFRNGIILPLVRRKGPTMEVEMEVKDKIEKDLRKSLQLHWDQYWSNETAGLCPLCVKHECDAEQRESGFALPIQLTAQATEGSRPEVISNYEVCSLQGWDVRLKFTNRRLVSAMAEDCLDDIAKSAMTGIRAQIEQQLLFRIADDVAASNLEQKSIDASNPSEVFSAIQTADEVFSSMKFLENGRWIIVNSSMQRALLETEMASGSSFISEAILNGKYPYHGFRFYKLDTTRFDSPFCNILDDRLILFHETSVGCAYTKEIVVKVESRPPEESFIECELRFGAITSKGAGIGEIPLPESS